MSQSFAETLSFTEKTIYSGALDGETAPTSSAGATGKYLPERKSGEHLTTSFDELSARTRLSLLSLLYFEF
jgi:hypothetical protein